MKSCALFGRKGENRWATRRRKKRLDSLPICRVNLVVQMLMICFLLSAAFGGLVVLRSSHDAVRKSSGLESAELSRRDISASLSPLVCSLKVGWYSSPTTLY
jgi:hypothetical protein